MGERSSERPDDSLARLRLALEAVPAGEVVDPAPIVGPLADAWSLLDGSSEGGMEDGKLTFVRVESVRWLPPELHFAIERHGATVMGSSRAEVQHWLVDVAEATADLRSTSRRQLRRQAHRWDAEKHAHEIVDAAVAGRRHPALEREATGRVRVVLKCIPELIEGPKQTVTGRRRKFSHAIGAAFAAAGWTWNPRTRWASPTKQ